MSRFRDEWEARMVFKQTKDEVIRTNGYLELSLVGTGTFKTTERNVVGLVLKEWKTYDAILSGVPVRIMVVDKITDIKHLDNILVGYHLVVNDKEWMLLQKKNEY